MTGLALGVDYALFMVSRFREELAGGANQQDAAAATVGRPTGRSSLPGAPCCSRWRCRSLSSLARFSSPWRGTVILVVVLTATVATVVVPPLLMLVGPKIDRWQIRANSESRSGVLRMVEACLRRPPASTVIIGLVVQALLAPVLALKDGAAFSGTAVHGQ
jgi:putative drug exporter of the RND superfamily